MDDIDKSVHKRIGRDRIKKSKRTKRYNTPKMLRRLQDVSWKNEKIDESSF